MAALQNYNFRARNQAGQVQAGVVQAASVEAAKKILLTNNLTPLSVATPKGIADFLPFGNKVSLKERTVFARQLATMIQAGLSLSQAMQLLIRQTKKGKMRTVMESIQNDIQDGFSFSTALARYPDVFDNIFINVVRSGEATGKLENVLEELSITMEKDVAVRGKIKGALAYPAFILVAMVGVAILMVTNVIPTLAGVLTSQGSALPPQTQFLLNVSAFMVKDGWTLLIALPIIILGLRYFLRTELGQQVWSVTILKLPVAGSITIESTMARFGRLLGMLLGSGVPLLEALRLINDSFTNRIFKSAMIRVASEVERGIPMSVPIEQNPAFPILVGQMVSVGEQTGKMDEIMVRLAAYYDQEVDTKVASMATLIEPFVIVLMGIGVAYLVVAILLPVYQASSGSGN